MSFSASRFLPFAIVAVLFSVLLVEPAAAQSLGGAESILQSIVDALQGNIIRLLAIIACIIVGLAWLFGYADLRMVGYFVVGAIIIFGAQEIVDLVAK